ncbi:MAG: hypothetical protein ACK5MZ_02760 [Aestuariibaculum sp.]
MPVNILGYKPTENSYWAFYTYTEQSRSESIKNKQILIINK